MKRSKFLVLAVSLCLVLALGLPLMTGCTGEGTPETPEIILGAPLSLGYPDGTCAKDNLQLAIDEINDGGGVDVGGTTYNFKLVTGDTRDLEPGADPDQALAVVDYLIDSQDADFIIGGPIRSDIALAAMDHAYTSQTIFLWSAGFLSPSFGPTVAGNLTKYKYCFRVQGSAAPQGAECVEIMEQVADDEGLAHEAYILHQQVSWALGAANGIETALTNDGWTVHANVAIPSGTTVFSSTLLAANTSGAPFLVAWFDMPESANLIKQWYDYQLPMLPIGFIVPVQDSLAWNLFTAGSDHKCEYVVENYPKAGVTPWNTQATHYIAEYEANVNVAGPGETWVAPTSYQAVFILKDAIEDAGTYTDDDAVIDALEATNSTGIFGNMHFDANHDMVYSQDPATGAISTWIQWIDGDRELIYPPVVAAVNVTLPSWM